MPRNCSLGCPSTVGEERGTIVTQMGRDTSDGDRLGEMYVRYAPGVSGSLPHDRRSGVPKTGPRGLHPVRGSTPPFADPVPSTRTYAARSSTCRRTTSGVGSWNARISNARRASRGPFKRNATCPSTRRCGRHSSVFRPGSERRSSFATTRICPIPDRRSASLPTGHGALPGLPRSGNTPSEPRGDPMSNDTHVREFLERMANEIYVPALDWRSPVNRARRHRFVHDVRRCRHRRGSRVSGGRSDCARSRGRGPANESTSEHASVDTSYGQRLDRCLIGYMNAVRSLHARWRGEVHLQLQGLCPEVAADWSPDGTHLAFTAICGTSCVTRGITIRYPRGGFRSRRRPARCARPRGRRAGMVSGRDAHRVREGLRAIPAQDLRHERGWLRANRCHPLPRPDASTSWSPDGSRIVYSSPGSAIRQQLDGSAPSPLAVNGLNPTWSPDGNTIAYFGALGSSRPGCDIRRRRPTDVTTPASST